MPTFVGVGAIAERLGSGDVTPEIPAAAVGGDLTLLLAGSISGGFFSSNPGTHSVSAGWTLIDTGVDLGGSLTSRFSLYYRRLESGDGDPTVTLADADPGGSQSALSAVILAYSGVRSAGDPWDVKSAATLEGVTDGTFTISGLTTTVDGCEIVFAACNDNLATYSSWQTATSPGALTERFDDVSGTLRLALASAAQSSAGATGDATVTLSDTATAIGWLLALASDSEPDALSGTLSPVGALAKKVTLAAFTGTVGLAGTLALKTKKPLASSISPTGAVTVDRGKTLLGTVTLAGELTKKVTRSLVGTLGLVGEMRQTGGPGLATLPSETLVPSDTLEPSDEGSIDFLNTAGTLGFSGVLTLKVKPVYRGTIIPAGATPLAVEIALEGSITPSGSFSKGSNFLVGTIAPSGVLTFAVKHSFAGTLTPTSALSPSVGIPVDEFDPAGLTPTEFTPAGLSPTELNPSGLTPTEFDPAGLEPTEFDPDGLDPTDL